MFRLVSLVALPILATCMCPFMDGTHGRGGIVEPGQPQATPQASDGYAAALATLDLDAVIEDITALLKTSQPAWPADYGNYGPFFIRLAWHCSGSYRTSDGRGGCDGGRQRFEPEQSWADNTNLDKARHLLWPIKEKYGLGLSWGDLFILAGTTAVQTMGGPVLGFCAGRIDDPDGSWSAELGPSPEQTKYDPCVVNGTCKSPLGTTTVGLIYLNPEGPMGVPDPVQTAPQVRDTFGRMAMNDSETVALIGGGHTFGKTHGACPDGPGPSPAEDPSNPWPGTCGSGKGADAFTSGFEGPWTSGPTSWDNEYFRSLVQYDWAVSKGPGGHNQWHVNGSGPVAPGPAGGKGQPVMMLTTDISLMHDPAFKKIVQEFSQDLGAFDNAFAHAWYKLTSRDMGPYARCTGKNVPPPQPWQFPLPPTPAKLANFSEVMRDVEKVLKGSSQILPPDTYVGFTYGPLFVRLAWRCASTFRVTDYQGGCNGARIRFSPQKDWPVNVALDSALLMLKPIKQKYGEGLSWADLITAAGYVAIEAAGGRPMKFCGGRTDALDGVGSKNLKPNITGDFSDSVDMLRWTMKISGLSSREFTVLNGGGHSLGQMHVKRSGYNGSWTSDPSVLSNGYFKALLNEEWEEYTVANTGKKQFRAKDKDLFMLKTDMLYKYDPELFNLARDYASDNELFLDHFALAWTKLANADRFDGPTGNTCDEKPVDHQIMME